MGTSHLYEHFRYLTSGIITALENIVLSFNKEKDMKLIPDDEYYIFAYYDIYSTIFDFFYAFDDSFDVDIKDNYSLDKKQNGIPKVECNINKVSSIDENPVLKEMFKNSNNDKYFKDFYGRDDVFSFIEEEKPLPLIYKGVSLDCGYRIDILVERDKLIIENKSVTQLTDVHLSQMLSYLKLADISLGFLFNFNVKSFKSGIGIAPVGWTVG
jgi:hypothetical protein